MIDSIFWLTIITHIVSSCSIQMLRSLNLTIHVYCLHDCACQLIFACIEMKIPIGVLLFGTFDEQHGGDVNAADHTGQTALHWSAVRGAIQVSELLLQEGARVNCTDSYGYQVWYSLWYIFFLFVLIKILRKPQEYFFVEELFSVLSILASG